MKKTNVLVTGGAGFIGKHFLKSLGIRGSSYDLVDGYDILDVSQLESIIKLVRPKCLVHLAAISNRQQVDHNPELAVKTNFVGTYNVLSLARKYKIRTILASSAATAAPELSLYGTTKDCMERLAALFDNVIIARFYNVYGKGSKSVVNKFVKDIRAGRKIILNGDTVRDYIFVGDVVNALVDMVDNVHVDGNKVINVGTHVGTNLSDLVKIIEEVLGKEAIREYGDWIKEIPISICRNKCKYYETPLIEGIRKLL